MVIRALFLFRVSNFFCENPVSTCLTAWYNSRRSRFLLVQSLLFTLMYIVDLLADFRSFLKGSSRFPPSFFLSLNFSSVYFCVGNFFVVLSCFDRNVFCSV